MVKRGFTIVELIIVITIMGILIVLGVVNLNSSQTNARDAERKSDTETIATALESVYNSGYKNAIGNFKIGQYPSTTDFPGSDPTQILKDIDTKALRAPSISVSSLIVATSNSTTSPVATISQDNYIYQPLTKDNMLCSGTDECRKFNLYYTLETAIGGISTFSVTSKHQ
jgi:prepilin-type N-terminal cleavage/methylation domain-containing protein